MAVFDLIKGKAKELLGTPLSKPGDTMDIHTSTGDLSAIVSKTGRQIVKASANEEVKYSAVRYPKTGTVVETRVTKQKK